MEKQIIGIDASRSNSKQKTGTEYYSYELIKNIIKFDEFNFRLYSKEPLTYLDKKSNVENRVMRFPRLWSQVRLSAEIYQNPPAVLFEPAHTIPLYHGKKTVITLHDVGFKYFPELYTPLERIYHNYCMDFSVRHATKIIAISNSTKNDLIKLYGAQKEKISVIYHGFDNQRFFISKTKPSEEIKSLQPYIFFIGRIEAKKNIKNLVKAFGRLKQNIKIKEKLVLAGRSGYQYEEIKKEIKLLPNQIQQDVIELGYVEDEKVGELTRHASLFAFPSRFEGFGMPLVETMACGVPIVASNTTSIPEIVDNAALMCDPDDIEGFAKNMSLVIQNENIKDDLVKKGLKRSDKFSWEKCARETLSVIESVIDN
jgi:glycosyltransferase involved in cell wall biosynthesis